MEKSAKRIIGALICCILLGSIGYFMGQYKPFTGGFLISIAEPFSPIRNQTAYGYTIVGLILGGVLGLMIKEKKEN